MGYRHGQNGGQVRGGLRRESPASQAAHRIFDAAKADSLAGECTILLKVAEKAKKMNFFDHHGVITLICLALFPRLTLLAAFSTGTVVWWLGWLFFPHLLVAIASTLFYWETNPLLVIAAWIVALGGTTAESKFIWTILRS